MENEKAECCLYQYYRNHWTGWNANSSTL